MSDKPENLPEPDGGEPLRIPRKRSPFRIDQDSENESVHSENPADYEFWCRMATWTLEEAVALSFGKEPEAVTWDAVSRADPPLPFGERFCQIHKLAHRAASAGVLSDPSSPVEFIDWATINRIPFSENLAVMVAGHLAEKAKRKAALERQKKPPVALDSAVNPKSVTTLLKLVGGLVTAIYKFDPAAKKSDVPRQIQSDLDLVGVSLDLDTIRKWAKESVRTAEISLS